MTVKSNIFMRVPKTPLGKEIYSFFWLGRHRRLLEKSVHDALVDYAAKVSKWNPAEGKTLDRPGIYDRTPFGADKQLYTELRLWYSKVKPKGKISSGEFSAYVNEAMDGKADYHLTAPTTVSQPLRLILKCAWNLANERGNGKATALVAEAELGKATAVFTYEGSADQHDNSPKDARPSAMKLIEQFAEFIGGKATVTNAGDIHRMAIEMPVENEYI